MMGDALRVVSPSPRGHARRVVLNLREMSGEYAPHGVFPRELGNAPRVVFIPRGHARRVVSSPRVDRWRVVSPRGHARRVVSPRVDGWRVVSPRVDGWRVVLNLRGFLVDDDPGDNDAFVKSSFAILLHKSTQAPFFYEFMSYNQEAWIFSQLRKGIG